MKQAYSLDYVFELYARLLSLGDDFTPEAAGVNEDIFADDSPQERAQYCQAAKKRIAELTNTSPQSTQS